MLIDLLQAYLHSTFLSMDMELVIRCVIFLFGVKYSMDSISRSSLREIIVDICLGESCIVKMVMVFERYMHGY